MLEKTVFNNASEIKEIIKKVYNIELEYIEKLNRGSANIYKLKSNNSYYILKEFQSIYTGVEVKKKLMLLII